MSVLSRRYILTIFYSLKIVDMNLSNIRNTKSYLNNLSDNLDQLVILFNLETGISSCRTLGSGASLPVLEYVLANAKKCTL